MSASSALGLSPSALSQVVKALEAAFKKAIGNAEHVKKMEDAGLALRVMTGEEYAKYYRDLHAQAAKYTEWALKMR